MTAQQTIGPQIDPIGPFLTKSTLHVLPGMGSFCTLRARSDETTVRTVYTRILELY
jgi:hypothetical protein